MWLRRVPSSPFPRDKDPDLHPPSQREANLNWSTLSSTGPKVGSKPEVGLTLGVRENIQGIAHRRLATGNHFPEGTECWQQHLGELPPLKRFMLSLYEPEGLHRCLEPHLSGSFLLCPCGVPPGPLCVAATQDSRVECRKGLKEGREASIGLRGHQKGVSEPRAGFPL